MAENLLQKLLRAAPVAQQQGFAGFFRYLGASTAPQSQGLPGPTDSEVLAADQRQRRLLAARPGGGSPLAGSGAPGGGGRLTIPSLVGV